MNVTPDSQHALSITRTFKAPPARVYAAWTDMKLMTRWWGCEDSQTLALEADIRVGGAWRWHLRTPQGEEMMAVGRYLELQPVEKVALTWSWADDPDWAGVESVITVTLRPHAEGTEMHFTHVGFPNDTSRNNHHEGWTSCLARLEKALATAAE